MVTATAQKSYIFKSRFFSHHIAMTLNVFKPMSSFEMWEKHTHVNIM